MQFSLTPAIFFALISLVDLCSGADSKKEDADAVLTSCQDHSAVTNTVHPTTRTLSNAYSTAPTMDLQSSIESGTQDELLASIKQSPKTDALRLQLLAALPVITGQGSLDKIKALMVYLIPLGDQIEKSLSDALVVAADNGSTEIMEYLLDQ